jgi:MoxR-like ATPase
MEISEVKGAAERLQQNVEGVVVGKTREVRLVLGPAGGRARPAGGCDGTGKTCAKALARSVDVDFGRVQFTPDLLPGELRHYFYNPKTGTSLSPGSLSRTSAGRRE